MLSHSRLGQIAIFPWSGARRCNSRQSQGVLVTYCRELFEETAFQQLDNSRFNGLLDCMKRDGKDCQQPVVASVFSFLTAQA